MAICQSRSQMQESLFLHGDNNLTAELQKIAKDELGEDEESRTRCLNKLRGKLKKETGLHWQDDDDFLLGFLRVKKFSAKRAFDLVKSFYNIKGKHPEVFYYSVDDWKATLPLRCFNLCLQRDRDHCTVLIFRISAWDIEALPINNLMSVGFLLILHVLRHHSAQIAGMKLVLDYKGLSFKQLLHIRPSHIWLFVKMMQDTFPLRMRELHILNENILFQNIWFIMKQILSKKLTERFHFHGNDVKGLHDFIDRKILPVDYGGENQEFWSSSDIYDKVEAASDYTNYMYSFGYEKFRKKR